MYFYNHVLGYPFFFLGQKKYHDTFRKFQKTPTHPSGTFRVMFHQKSTCTPPPPPPALCINNRAALIPREYLGVREAAAVYRAAIWKVGTAPS